MNFLICFYILMILVGICMPAYGRKRTRGELAKRAAQDAAYQAHRIEWRKARRLPT